MILRPLKSGDKIGVIAPSSPVSGDIIPKVRDFLEEYGFQVEFGKSVFLSMRGYLSGSARKRADGDRAAGGGSGREPRLFQADAGDERKVSGAGAAACRSYGTLHGHDRRL